MKNVSSFLIGTFILLLLITLNWWVFDRWLDRNYWEWYMNTGKFIGVGLSVTSMVWGKMGEHPGLISKNPLTYMGSYLQLAGLPIFTLGTHLRGKNDADAFDKLVTILMVFIVTASMGIYLIALVPLQYFLFLLVGAPARTLGQSSQMVAAKFAGSALEVKAIDRTEKMESGWWQASMSEEPVELTGLLSSLFLAVLDALVA